MSSGIAEIKHSKSGASCQIHPFGATLLSFKTRSGREVLFVSRDAKLDGTKAIRGGIPLVFPIFGPPKDASSTMPQHGFARNNVWTKGESYDEEDSAGVRYTLELKDVSDGRGTDNPWQGDQYNVSLQLDVKVSAELLTTTLHVTNTGTVSFPFQCLFHTYYHVENRSALDPSQCYVQGLEGYSVTDKVSKSEYIMGSYPVTISGEVDNVYTPPTGQDIPSVTIGVGNDSAIVLNCTGRVDGEIVPVSIVVWNPYELKAAAMGDFGSDQFVDMICVEPGILGEPVLEAGKTASLTQVIHG